MFDVERWMFRLPPSAPWRGERPREPDSKSVGQASRLSPFSTFVLQHSMFDARRVVKLYAVQARVLIVERASFARGSRRCPSPIGWEKVSEGRLRADQMRVVREKQFNVSGNKGEVSKNSTIERAADSQPTMPENVRINHRRAHIGMAQQLLQGADVRSRFQQVRR